MALTTPCLYSLAQPGWFELHWFALPRIEALRLDGYRLQPRMVQGAAP